MLWIGCAEALLQVLLQHLGARGDSVIGQRIAQREGGAEGCLTAVEARGYLVSLVAAFRCRAKLCRFSE